MRYHRFWQWLLTHVFAVVLVLLASGLLLRLILIISPTDVGLELQSRSWWNATIGQFFGEQTPLQERKPTDQAKYWLAKIEHCDETEKQSAVWNAGAALLLDSPGPAFIKHHFQSTDSTAGPIPLPPTLDNEVIQDELDAFESACVNRCLMHARRATELDPDEPRWWRLRAMLLFSKYFFGDRSSSPRTKDWKDILDLCAKHDPDNGLYDYLASYYLWEDAAEQEWDDKLDDLRLEVHDATGFAEGIEHFKKGLRKPLLHVGWNGGSSILICLQKTNMPETDQTDAAINRFIQLRESSLIQGLHCWVRTRSNTTEHGGELEESLRLLKQELALSQQVFASDEIRGFELWQHIKGGVAIDRIIRIAGDHPGLIGEDEIKRLGDLKAKWQSKFTAISAVAAQLPGAQLAQQSKSMYWFIVLSDSAQRASGLVLMVAAASGVIAWLIGRKLHDPTRRLAWYWHLIAWILGFGISFCVLGLAPAGILPAAAQQTIVLVTGGLLLSAITGQLLWHYYFHRRFRYSLRAMFAVMTAVACLCFVWVSLDIRVTDIVTSVTFSECEIEGVSANYLRNNLQMQKESLAWAFFQWLAYYGPHVGIVLSLLFIFIWHLFSGIPKPSHDGSRNSRQRWLLWTRQLCSQTAVSSFVAFLFLLCVYLWCAPPVIQLADAKHRWTMMHIQNNAEYYNNIHKMIADKLANDSGTAK